MSRSIHKIEIDGQAVWVEMEEVPLARSAAPKFADTSAPRELGTTAVEAIRKMDVAQTLGAVVAPVRDALSRFQPEEVTIELSLGFKADVGVFVASGEASALVKVTAKLKPAKPAES